MTKWHDPDNQGEHGYDDDCGGGGSGWAGWNEELTPGLIVLGLAGAALGLAITLYVCRDIGVPLLHFLIIFHTNYYQIAIYIFA